MFLAFDPAVSRHHEVYFFPKEEQQCQEKHLMSPRTKRPEEKVLHVFVFSSRIGQWESREFRPRHSGSAHLYDVVTAPRGEDEKTWWSAEYWRGSLYVHCHSGVLMILRCSERIYDMIQLPGQPSDNETVYQLELPTRYLASYEKGIRYVMMSDFHLEVWELTDSVDDRLGWKQIHKANLKERDHKLNYLREEPSMQPRMEWAVVVSSKDLISLFDDYSDEESNDDYDEESDDNCDDWSENNEDEGEEEKEQEDNCDVAQEEEEEIQYNVDETQGEVEKKQYNDDNETRGVVDTEQYNSDETQGEEDEEEDGYDFAEDEELARSECSDHTWNSDQHNFIDFDSIIVAEEDVSGWGCTIVGFHPYKDVLLLKFSDTVVAYHLHTSRMQYLGYVYPYNHHQQAREIHLAFPYRPCYVDDLPSRKAPTSY
jgi:hypothetical protein